MAPPHPPNPYSGLPRGTTQEEMDLYSAGGPFWWRGLAEVQDDKVVCGWAEELKEKLGVRRVIGVCRSISIGDSELITRDIHPTSKKLWIVVTAQLSLSIQVSHRAAGSAHVLMIRDLLSVRRGFIIARNHIHHHTSVQDRSAFRSSTGATHGGRGIEKSIYREGRSTCHLPKEAASDCDRRADSAFVDPS